VPLAEVKRFCWSENIVTVRAILSWEAAPPAGSPDFVPVWGGSLDAQVQIAPSLLEEIPITSLIGSGLLTVDEKILMAIDTNATLPAHQPTPLSAAALKSIYTGTPVPPHRWGFTAAKTMMTKPLNQAIQYKGPIDLGPILTGLATTSGSTEYEQLTCAGYNPQTQELEAVIEIKQNAGYSGGLCTAGSYEYVAFFAYFGGAWNALGSAAVNVHDLETVAAGNTVNYAVFRLSPVTSMPCEQLESIPLRAILSWQQQPTGPDFVPVWGNVLDTNIQPQIGTAQDYAHTTLMQIGQITINNPVGGIAANPNYGGDYLANATGVAGDLTCGDDSPFAGNIMISGEIIDPNTNNVFDPVTGAVLPGAYPIIYQAWITFPNNSSPPLQLTNGFNLAVYPPYAPALHPEVEVPQAAQTVPALVSGQPASALYYTYYATGQAVSGFILGSCSAYGLPEGNYTIEIDAYSWNAGTASYQPIGPVSQSFYVYNGYAAGGGAPLLAFYPTSAVECGNIPQDATLTGAFSVADDFFGWLSIYLTPIDLNNMPVNLPAVTLVDASNNPLPNPVVYDGTNTSGVSGSFSFSTAGMPQCGYTVQAVANDRALVSTSCNNHQSSLAFGFCLVAPAN